MSTLHEQFSAARKSQIEAQLKLFSKFSARAVSGAEQLIALNFNTAKAAVDHSAALLRQMLAAKDPRDLLALAGESQQQFDGVLAYGRALAGIASGLQANLGEVALPVTVRKAPALPATEKIDALEELVPPAEPELAPAEPELAVELAPAEPELAVELAPAEPEAPKKAAPKAKPIAKAAAKAAGKTKAAKPAAVPFPKVAGRAENSTGQLDMLATRRGKKK